MSKEKLLPRYLVIPVGRLGEVALQLLLEFLLYRRLHETPGLCLHSLMVGIREMTSKMTNLGFAHLASAFLVLTLGRIHSIQSLGPILGRHPGQQGRTRQKDLRYKVTWDVQGRAGKPFGREPRGLTLIRILTPLLTLGK